MKRTALTTVLLAAGTAAYAQTQQRPATPQPQPALVSHVQASAQDSPLVQAAKRKVGARRKAPIAVITNATVTKSTTVLTTSSGGADIPQYTAKATYTPSTSAPAPAPAAQSAAQSQVSRAGFDNYALLAASDPCLPPVSQNASTAAAPRTAQNSGYAQNSAPARPAQNSVADATAVPMATNSSSGLSQSQNAGPNRPVRP